MKKFSNALLLATFITFFSCDQEVEAPTFQLSSVPTNYQRTISPDMSSFGNARTSGDIQQWMSNINSALASEGLQLSSIEALGAEGAGVEVFFEDRGNKWIGVEFLPADPRTGPLYDIPYVVDGTELGTSSGMTEQETYDAIYNAMSTWDEVKCSDGLNLPEFGAIPVDLGVVQFFEGLGGSLSFFPGFITHAGILPGAFFDALDSAGGDFILGVTFTFTWIEDLDQDGVGDVAIKEIYMNDNFNWQDAPDDVLGNGIYDFETVMLHEVGHGLNQAHFGKAFRTTANGKLHFAPYALMNAGYTIANRSVTKTDNAGHCSIWGEYPND